MSAFSEYLASQTETKLARQQYETASVRISLCEIRERRAECISQHLPLADYQDKKISRKELIEIINYVVCGRKEL